MFDWWLADWLEKMSNKVFKQTTNKNCLKALTPELPVDGGFLLRRPVICELEGLVLGQKIKKVVFFLYPTHLLICFRLLAQSQLASLSSSEEI